MPSDEERADPFWQQVRKALGRLCTNGVERYWIQDEAGILLELAIVQTRIPGMPATQRTAVDALIAVLKEMVGAIRETQHGRLLWIVLALDDQYLGLNATKRRTIAGERFREGRRTVSANTIRQHHEPRALDRLTRMMIARERRLRNEES